MSETARGAGRANGRRTVRSSPTEDGGEPFHTVAPSTAERALIWLGFPLVGAGLGWLVLVLADWATEPGHGIPLFRGPLKLIASLPEPQGTLAAVALGLAGGLAVAYAAVRDYLIVTISDNDVTISHDGSSWTVPRSAVDVVFLDRKQLVLLGHATEELVREGGDADAGRLERAFVAHGYPWRPDGDPHAGAYRRWVDDTPDLPAAANAILRMRDRALDKGDQDDVRELRAELAKLGLVVRDEKKRQFWRPTRADAD